MALFSVLSGCGLLLGLDSGLGLVAETDASGDGTVPSPGPEAGEPADDSSIAQEAAGPLPVPEASAPIDAGAHSAPPRDAGIDASCTPDPGWCDLHCGSGPDNCGASRQCPQCPTGEACNASNACECQRDPSWCTGRCGPVNDNCGVPIDCGTCPSMQCTPESMQQACGNRQCGQVVNNCNQTINCGLLGILSTCTNPSQVCLSSGQCCAPNSGTACGNQCGTFVTDNCGRSVQCPTTCASGLVCYQGTCCTPNNPCGNACGVSRVNSCGQTVQCGCSAGNAECVTATNTCCVPQGCSADCVDSCGLASASCCVDAGPEAGPDAGSSPEAGDGVDGDPTETGTAASAATSP